MKTKTKLLIGFCVIAFCAFMGMLWHDDYEGTQDPIEVETPEVGDEVRG